MKEAGESLEFLLGTQRAGISVHSAQNSLKGTIRCERCTLFLKPLEEFTAGRSRYTEPCPVFALLKTDRTMWPDSITAFSLKLEILRISLWVY